jgi:cob(I)alamin adenosyltransferase
VGLFPFGLERVLGPQSFRFKNEEGDFEQARAALQKSRELTASGEWFLVILDEILAAVMSGLLSEKDVMDLLDLYDSNRRCELVLTGHKVWPALVERADLVTEMRKEKHYFDRQEPPKEGVEY